MERAIQAIEDILASQEAVDPTQRARLESYLVGIRTDLERLNVPTFVLGVEQRRELKAKAKELVDGAKDIVVYQVSGLVSVGMQYEQDRPYFGDVNESETLRNLTFPIALDAAVFLDDRGRAIPLPKSNYLPMDDQREMIENDFNQALNIPGAKGVMLHAPFSTQMDIKHQKEAAKKLIVGFYARTPDQTFDSLVAHVGRLYSGHLLRVNGWDRDGGYDEVWALPAVVSQAVKI